MGVDNKENNAETDIIDIENATTKEQVCSRTKKSVNALNTALRKTGDVMTKPFKSKGDEQPTQRIQVEAPQKYDFDRVSTGSVEYKQIKDEFKNVIPQICDNDENINIYKSWDVYRFWKELNTEKGNIDCFFYLKKMKIGSTIQYLPLSTVDDSKFSTPVHNPCYGEKLALIGSKPYEMYGNNAILKNDLVFDVPVFNGVNYGKKFDNLIPKYNLEKTKEHCTQVVRDKELKMEWIDDLLKEKIQLTPEEKKLLLYTVKEGINQKYSNSNMQQINLKNRLENSLVLDKEVKVSWDTYSRTFILKDNEGKKTPTSITVSYKLDSDGKLTMNDNGSNLSFNNIWTPRIKESWKNIKLAFDSNDVNTYKNKQIKEFSELYNAIDVTWLDDFSLTSALYPYNSTESTDAIDPKAIDENGNVKLSDHFYYAQDKKIYDKFGKEVSQIFVTWYAIKDNGWNLSFIQINDKNIKPYHLLTFNKDGSKWDVQPHYDWQKLIIYDKKWNQISECPVDWKQQANPDDKDAWYKYKENEEIKLEAEDFYPEVFKKVQVDNTLLTTEQLKNIFKQQFDKLPDNVKKFKWMKVKQKDGTTECYTVKSKDDMVTLTKKSNDEISKLIENLVKMNEKINNIKNTVAKIKNNWDEKPLSSKYAEAGMGMKFELDSGSISDFPNGLNINVILLNNSNINSTVTLKYKGKNENWNFELNPDQDYSKFQLKDTKYKLEFKDGQPPVLTLNTLSRKDQ